MAISRVTLGLIGLIVLLAVSGVWVGEPLQGFWRWPAGLLLLLVAWEYNLATGSLSFHRISVPAVPLGERVEYCLTAINQTNTPLVFETQADYPSDIDADRSLQRWRLDGLANENRTFAITATRLGDTVLGRLYWKQLGRFGLCWWSYSYDDDTSVRVEPARLEKIFKHCGLQVGGQKIVTNRQDSGVDLLDLREYRPGDSIRTVDWKATARRRKPIVRNFEREHRLEIVILIDCGISSRIQCGTLDRLHHYVNVTAKLTELAGVQGDRIGCIAYAQKVIGITALSNGPKAVSRNRALIGGLKTTNETANALQAALEVKHLLKHRGLVVFLTEIEQADAASQLIQGSRLLSGKHKVLVGTLEDPAIAGMTKRAYRTAMDSYGQLAALEYLRGRQLSCDRLIRQGVAITSATATNLDRNVIRYYQANRDAIVGA